MSSPLQIAAIATSVLLLVVIFDLVRRKKLTEEYSFVWIICGLALLGLSFSRNLLDAVALALGIAYGPAVLLLILIVFVFIGSLSFSVVASRQRKQIERLIEDVALLEAAAREREEREKRAAGLGSGMGEKGGGGVTR